MFNSTDWVLLIILGGLISFLYASPNLLNFILLSEISWIGLYLLAVIHGTQMDSALLLSWSLFVLCIAAAESVIGLSLLMFKFIIYHNVRDDYYNNLNKEYNLYKLNYSTFTFLND